MLFSSAENPLWYPMHVIPVYEFRQWQSGKSRHNRVGVDFLHLYTTPVQEQKLIPNCYLATTCWMHRIAPITSQYAMFLFWNHFRLFIWWL